MSTNFPTQTMDRVAANFHGVMGYYVEDMTTGESHGYNADHVFPTASVFKVAVMIELFRQAAEGKLRLDARYRVRDDITRHGTGMLSMLSDYPEMSLYDYYRFMMIYSDNVATDMVMDAVGLENVNPTLERLGFHDTRVNMTMTRWQYVLAGLGDLPQTPENTRKMERTLGSGKVDLKSVMYTRSSDGNASTPQDMAGLLKLLHRGDAVSPEASADMIATMKICRDRSKTRAPLKIGTVAANKTGTSRRIKADAAILYLPSGPLLITAFTLASDDDDRGNEAIAEVSRLAVGAVSPESLLK